MMKTANYIKKEEKKAYIIYQEECCLYEKNTQKAQLP